MAFNLSAFAGAGAQFFDSNGTPLAGGLLYVYTAGTTTPATSWTTNSGTVANTNPIVLNAAGRTPFEIWLNSGVTYKFALYTSTNVLIGTYDNIPAIDDPTVFNNLITVTGTNTLIGTSVPPYTSYVAGMTLSFIPVNTNTGAVTIDVDGLGAKNIFVGATGTFTGGELVAGQIAQIEYDGTRFQLMNVQATVPVGSIIAVGRASPPPGWLAANGSAVSRTTYAALFAAIGTAFGAGNGSTTFNVPDLRDRVAIGSGTLYALADTGGSKDAIVVSHTHTANGVGDHQHFVVSSEQGATQQFNTTVNSGNFASAWTGTSGLNESYNMSGVGTTSNIGLSSAAGAHNHSINSTGTSGTNANLPPYIGLLHCIKF
jgi:microcystin-dependent protein